VKGFRKGVNIAIERVNKSEIYKHRLFQGLRHEINGGGGGLKSWNSERSEKL